MENIRDILKNEHININIIFIKGTVLTSILIIVAYNVLMKYVNFSVVFIDLKNTSTILDLS